MGDLFLPDALAGLSFDSGGRPDTMKLLKETYNTWEAEVIFITSNYQGNREMMEGCKAAGIPAFVSIGLLSLSLC